MSEKLLCTVAQNQSSNAGGQNADKTSIYHLADGTWTEAETMHISRGYGSACLLSNGKVCDTIAMSHIEIAGFVRSLSA